MAYTVGPGSLTMAVTMERLSKILGVVQSTGMDAYMITGELLVFSLSWKPEEAGSNISRGTTQQQGRWIWQLK